MDGGALDGMGGGWKRCERNSIQVSRRQSYLRWFLIPGRGRGRVNTRDKRTLLLALQRRNRSRQPRRFWPFALPGSRHGKGDLLDKRFMNPSAMPVCYLFYRRVYTRGSQKMRGWYVHANDPQREILKKERPSYYRINHFQTRELLHLSRQLFAVINNGVFAGILSFARSQIIQTNPGSRERGHICEFPN